MQAWLRTWVHSNRAFLIFLMLLGLFRTAVADWNPIPSGSMRPTLLEGDVVLVNRLAFNLKLPLSNILVAHTGDPHRGDIVTFFSPKDDKRLIKRLVAVPSDTVEMRNKILIVNGKPQVYAPIGIVREPVKPNLVLNALRLDEGEGKSQHVVQWLRPQQDDARDSFAPIVVPTDHYLMLGDNRDNSADYRYFGLVPRNLLIGRAVGVIASADITQNWQPRFERFGSRLNN